MSFFYAVMNFAFSDFGTGCEVRDHPHGPRVVRQRGHVRLRQPGAGRRRTTHSTAVTSPRWVGDDLAAVFSGNIEIPMLDERVEILNEAG